MKTLVNFINESLNKKNKSKVLKDILDGKYKIKDKNLVKLLKQKSDINESTDEDVKLFLREIDDTVGELIDDTVSEYKMGDKRVIKALKDLETDLLDFDNPDSLGFILYKSYCKRKKTEIDMNDPSISNKYIKKTKRAFELALNYV